MRITEKTLAKAERPAAGQALIWDDLLQGFGARLTPTKTAFVVQWREGKRKPRLGIGHWPAMTVEAAREVARRKLAGALKTAGTGATAPLARAMRGWEQVNLAQGTWRPRYAERIDSIITLYIEGQESERVPLAPAVRAAIGVLGSTPVTSVTRANVTAVTDALPRGTADGVLAIISSFFGWAMDRDWVVGNPARNRLRLTGGRRKRTRLLTDEEVLAIWRGFLKEGEPALSVFELLLLTGARRNEVLRMRWDEVNLKAATWTLPAERRKNGKQDPEPFEITLAPRAIAALQRQPRLESSQYVFWGRRDGKAFTLESARLDRVRERASVKHWIPHDFRRYIRTWLAANGVSQVVAEMILGHISTRSGVIGVYDQHSYEPEMREAWLKWGSHVAELAQRL